MPIIVDEVIISVEVGNRGAGASPGEATDRKSVV